MVRFSYDDDIYRNKETKGKAAAYLGRLQENYTDLFPEPLQKSALTETDIRMIEKELGYELPKPYIDFLQSYQLPDCFTVSVSFCGDYAVMKPIRKMTYLSGCILCKDFYDFLRLVCTKDIYNEDCLKFMTMDEIAAL